MDTGPDTVTSTKSPLSMISSTSSMLSTVSSEGLVMVASGAASVTSSPPELVERKAGGSSSYASSSSGSCEEVDRRESSEEEVESVDGLVLMGSTRLRPAPEASSSTMSKARLYIQTFRSMFCRQDCTSAILPLALHGNLQDNPFRSLCWRVLLNVLPSSSMDWVKAMQTLRTNYQFLQAKFHTEERLQDVTLDPAINNPLSQAEDSPWNQHFQDGEIRRLIKQDVVRTFPEVEFFQTHVVRETLVNILFVYARCHPEIGYRQGMHELLAPLFFVLKSDCDKFSDITAGLKDNDSDEAVAVYKELKNTVHEEIFNSKVCEADTFSLFESLMEGVGPWFISNKSMHTIGVDYQGKPWSRPQDQTTGNKLVDNLNYIQDVLLRRHDPALFSRLEKLEIFPQIYGIRWLRLLFGREFVFRDTLLLWDAIFADSCPPRLCDQLVVSLLMSVRDLLLRYDYQDAVQLLMKLPSNLSVTYCTQFALHLKDPLRFPKPSGSAFAHGVVKAREKKKVVRSENKFRKISAPKIFTKNQTGDSKSPFELVKPTAETDSASDFTVLEAKNDSEDATNKIQTKHPVTKLKDLSSKKNGNVKARDIVGVKTDLKNAVATLDNLLKSESLIKETEISETLDRMKMLVSELPTPRMDNGLMHRTASVAVDVSAYFKED